MAVLDLRSTLNVQLDSRLFFGTHGAQISHRTVRVVRVVCVCAVTVLLGTIINWSPLKWPQVQGPRFKRPVQKNLDV